MFSHFSVNLNLNCEELCSLLEVHLFPFWLNSLSVFMSVPVLCQTLWEDCAWPCLSCDLSASSLSLFISSFNSLSLSCSLTLLFSIFLSLSSSLPPDVPSCSVSNEQPPSKPRQRAANPPLRGRREEKEPVPRRPLDLNANVDLSDPGRPEVWERTDLGQEAGLRAPQTEPSHRDTEGRTVHAGKGSQQVIPVECLHHGCQGRTRSGTDTL